MFRKHRILFALSLFALLGPTAPTAQYDRELSPNPGAGAMVGLLRAASSPRGVHCAKNLLQEGASCTTNDCLFGRQR